MNVFDFAMQTELDSNAHYEKLSGMTPVAGLKKLFSILAANELKHYNVVSAIKAGVPAEMADSTVLEDAESIFQDLQVNESDLGQMRTAPDAFRYAMKIEEDSIRFYEDIAQKETNPATILVLLQIAGEEKKHYTVVEKINNLVEGHNNFIVMHKLDKFGDI